MVDRGINLGIAAYAKRSTYVKYFSQKSSISIPVRNCYCGFSVLFLKSQKQGTKLFESQELETHRGQGFMEF